MISAPKPTTASYRRLAMGLLILISVFGQSLVAQAKDQTKFRRVPTQFIAALGDPQASSGGGAETWGIWYVDPGPRGVWLAHFKDLMAIGGVAPAKWTFDQAEWWVDENGLLMEKPDFPVKPGKFVVTGDRETVAILTIHEADSDGNRRWELDRDAKLYDVTHLPCRSARYTPISAAGLCTPAVAPRSAWPVTPGGIMPPVDGCKKQDYSVLFVIGVAVDN